MRVQLECCILGRAMQDRSVGSYVASELHGREELSHAYSVLGVRLGTGRGKVLNDSGFLRPGT